MKITVNKKDLISLVHGTGPAYEIMNHWLIKPYGEFNASYGRWEWSNSELNKLTEEVLWDIYNKCKNSWK